MKATTSTPKPDLQPSAKPLYEDDNESEFTDLEESGDENGLEDDSTQQPIIATVQPLQTPAVPASLRRSTRPRKGPKARQEAPKTRVLPKPRTSNYSTDTCLSEFLTSRSSLLLTLDLVEWMHEDIIDLDPEYQRGLELF